MSVRTRCVFSVACISLIYLGYLYFRWAMYWLTGGSRWTTFDVFPFFHFRWIATFTNLLNTVLLVTLCAWVVWSALFILDGSEAEQR